MMLFSNIFDSLSKMVRFRSYSIKYYFLFLGNWYIFFNGVGQEYDPELFNKALPCLTAIGCALPPDYALTTSLDDEWYNKSVPAETNGPYVPQPINTSMSVSS